MFVSHVQQIAIGATALTGLDPYIWIHTSQELDLYRELAAHPGRTALFKVNSVTRERGL
ncbi:MAG: hypothetical protein JO042_17010 [Sinobacteraceae bacterium]|nr:hypothetical protein [Nevskiaceae bacterium]